MPIFSKLSVAFCCGDMSITLSLFMLLFLFYLSTLDDCLAKSRDDCLTKFNQPITENCDVSVMYFVRHMIGSFDWLRLVNQTVLLVSRNSNPYHSKTAPFIRTI